MYRLIRDIHLVLGLAAGLFMAIYGLTAGTMSAWPVVAYFTSTTTERIQVPADLDPDLPAPAVAAALRARGLIEGPTQFVKTSSGAIELGTRRPGVGYEVEWDRGPQLTIAIERSGFLELLEDLHHLSGMHHEDPRMSYWGVVLFVMSGLSLALGGSGVWLWWLRHKERRVGGILLACTTALAALLIVLVRM